MIRRKLQTAALATFTLLVITGCQTGKYHEEAVNAANDRWLSLRTGLKLKLAQQQFDTGDLKQAKSTLTEALSVDPTNAHLYVLAGRISLEEGRLERAYKQLELAIKHDEDLPDPHYYQGIILQRWQQFGRATEAYRNAYDREKDNAAYLLAMSEMLVADDKRDEALSLLLDRMQYFDQNAGIRVAIGRLYVMQKQFEEAVKYLEYASLMRPEDVQLREELGLAQVGAGHYTDAIHTIERLLKEEDLPNRETLERSLAEVYRLARMNEQARSMYRKLAYANEGDVDLWRKLAETSWEIGDASGTLAAAQQMIRLSPETVDGYLLGGLAWQKKQRLDRALEMFELAVDRSADDDNRALLLRGIALEKADRLQEAADMYTQALERQPGDQRARRLQARLQGELTGP